MVRAELSRQTPTAVRQQLTDNPSMQAMMETQLKGVRQEVHKEAVRVLQQIVREDKYRHINSALVEELKERVDARVGNRMTELESEVKQSANTAWRLNLLTLSCSLVALGLTLKSSL